MIFEKKKVQALSGKTEVHFTLQTNEASEPFVIVASGSGVCFRGRSPDFFGQEGAELLAQTIGAAFTEYTRLKPRLSASAAGH